ncbi:hypothetical protein KC874_01415 [Candidatus Saccharibacteria bacterium]|nr:hypothetical protein [Candidatus Saccharibacteria bacterium]
MEQANLVDSSQREKQFRNRVIGAGVATLAILAPNSSPATSAESTSFAPAISASAESISYNALATKTNNRKKYGRVTKPKYYGPKPLNPCYTTGSRKGTVPWQNCDEGNEFVYAYFTGTECVEYSGDRQVVSGRFTESADFEYIGGPGVGIDYKNMLASQPDLFKQKPGSKKNYRYGFDLFLGNFTKETKVYNLALYPLYGKKLKKVATQPAVSEDINIAPSALGDNSQPPEGTMPSNKNYRISTHYNINSRIINGHVTGSPIYEIKPTVEDTIINSKVKAYLLKVAVRDPRQDISMSREIFRRAMPGSKSDQCYVGKFGRLIRPEKL